MRHSWDWITTGRTVTHTNNSTPLHPPHPLTYPPPPTTTATAILPHHPLSWRRIHKYMNRRARGAHGHRRQRWHKATTLFFSSRQHMHARLEAELSHHALVCCTKLTPDSDSSSPSQHTHTQTQTHMHAPCVLSCQ